MPKKQQTLHVLKKCKNRVTDDKVQISKKMFMLDMFMRPYNLLNRCRKSKVSGSKVVSKCSKSTTTSIKCAQNVNKRHKMCLSSSKNKICSNFAKKNVSKSAESTAQESHANPSLWWRPLLYCWPPSLIIFLIVIIIVNIMVIIIIIIIIIVLIVITIVIIIVTIAYIDDHSCCACAALDTQPQQQDHCSRQFFVHQYFSLLGNTFNFSHLHHMRLRTSLSFPS